MKEHPRQISLTRPPIIGFAGRIGAGKTTLSRMAAAQLHLPWTGFGDLVRAVAVSRGESLARDSLQALGDSLIQQGWWEFCQALLSQAGWRDGGGLVIDGLRHVGAVETLRALTLTSPMVVVFVDLAPGLRQRRLEAKGAKWSDILAADSHPNEAQVASVRALADVVVDNSGELEATCDSLLARLDGLLNEPRPNA